MLAEFDLSSNSTALSNEFIEHFDSLIFQISWGVTMLSNLLISNVLFSFLILFDRHGGDWAKRSLLNQLSSQCAYPVIIHNLIITPIWSYRVFIGPLNPTMAELTVVIANSCIIWVLLCLTEALLTRAIMATSYKYVSGINDMFFSNFIFMVNFGFSLGSHCCLGILGLYLFLARLLVNDKPNKKFLSLFVGSFRNDELLTGIRNGNAKMSLFYPIVFGTTCVFACYSAVTIAVKKFIGYKKDKNLVKNITIMIDSGESVLRINNVKHNNPIIGSLPIIATTTLFAGFGLISFRNVVSGDGPVFQFWFIWFAEIFFKTILPLLVIIKDKSFCSFIQRFIEHL